MTSKMRTAQAGVAFATWQLTRRDWEVLPVPDAPKRSTLLQIKKESFAGELLIQSRAFSGLNAVSLGEGIVDPNSLPFDWLIISTNIRSDTPTCFLLNRQDVLETMKRDPNGPLFWIDPLRYKLSRFQDRWDEIGLS
ncbi:hypothetical protein [Acetobacter sp. UBA5411]|uniref:hypothetical protein n=1 Tax=Acetobacter sp. UBA5411 TaxID=1945905 RepID=UPI0025BA8758|nr:hypothetical protein [Acetobacter sp. UBA5411]